MVRFRAEAEADDDLVEVYPDSDWAGCPRTRKSTSGGVVVGGGGVVKTWSSTQATHALSSGEAEYYVAVRAAAEGLGMVALMRDLGWAPRLRIYVGSSAAKSVASRVGLGRLRHLEVKFLWLQDAVRQRRLELRKVRGDSNPADWLTKPGSTQRTANSMRSWGVDLVVQAER